MDFLIVWIVSAIIGALWAMPVGIVGAIAAKQILNGNIKAARLMSVGVCLGDVVLASGSLLFLVVLNKTIEEVESVLGQTASHISSIAIVAAVIVFIMMFKKDNIKFSGKAGLLGGFLFTISNFANIGAFFIAFKFVTECIIPINSIFMILIAVIGVFMGGMLSWTICIKLFEKHQDELKATGVKVLDFLKSFFVFD